MDVYIVTVWRYCNKVEEIDSVFSSKEKAESYAEFHNSKADFYDDYYAVVRKSFTIDHSCI